MIKIIEGYCRSFLWTGEAQITKKALTTWDIVCTPKTIGGMGLINMEKWNKAAASRLCWDLAHKEDKLWIKWVHTFYIKSQGLWTIPKQASWMIRKIMGAKDTIDQMQQTGNRNGSKIKNVYPHMIGEQPRVEWKSLMFKNAARPKAYFIMWLIPHKRLATVDRWRNGD